MPIVCQFYAKDPLRTWNFFLEHDFDPPPLWTMLTKIVFAQHPLTVNILWRTRSPNPALARCPGIVWTGNPLKGVWKVVASLSSARHRAANPTAQGWKQTDNTPTASAPAHPLLLHTLCSLNYFMWAGALLLWQRYPKQGWISQGSPPPIQNERWLNVYPAPSR